jgi:hypothetical protein
VGPPLAGRGDLARPEGVGRSLDRLRFDRDRAFAVLLVVATAFLIVELAAPGITRPLAAYFAWGGADVIGDAGWMWFCIASVAGLIAGLRPR